MGNSLTVVRWVDNKYFMEKLKLRHRRDDQTAKMDFAKPAAIQQQAVPICPICATPTRTGHWL
ncbi:MAG: hypothetical protein CMM01_18130 [Rhodopirellula sp.]|nr:hypothetical protein [Rhodopirellula sp.]